jgi:acetate kinase
MQTLDQKIVIALNCGSSSVKWASYAVGPNGPNVPNGPNRPNGPDTSDEPAMPVLIQRGSTSGADQAAIESVLKAAAESVLQLNPKSDANLVANLAKNLSANQQIFAVGHRVVHGALQYSAPTRINEAVIKDLQALSPLAPLHQPVDILGIRIAQTFFPKANHVAVFDTAFHRGHAFEHDTYALPKKFYDQGIRRYGFHGISYQYIAQTLARMNPALSKAKVVIAHLGSGASMCAMHHGKSQACTMGFSALDGLPMGSRSGQIDPGVLLYFMQHYQMSANEISDLLYKESGLKGLSGMTGDMRELLAANEPAARQAIDYFVARCCYEIGGLASVLEGLDVLVFTGGMGERADEIRTQMGKKLSWLGIEIDSNKNQSHQQQISSDQSKVLVLCLPTDEECMIAQDTFSLCS